MQASYYVSRKMVLVFRKMTVDKFKTIQLLFVSNKDYAYIKLLLYILKKMEKKKKERKKNSREIKRWGWTSTAKINAARIQRVGSLTIFTGIGLSKWSGAGSAPVDWTERLDQTTSRDSIPIVSPCLPRTVASTNSLHPRQIRQMHRNREEESFEEIEQTLSRTSLSSFGRL